MKRDNLRGAARVFSSLFYTQDARDQIACTNVFIAAPLTFFFGDATITENAALKASSWPR